jgi:hypothetical protein
MSHWLRSRATLQARMDLDANALLASLLIGLVGAACFMYGKRQGRVPPMLVGVVMCIYPYFVPGVAVMVVIAVVLLTALWATARLGY